jgi:GH24 family phage-related lysozyme (muramidase)
MADADVSDASRAALTTNRGKLKALENFINRYEQKYFPFTGKNVRDPRMTKIFGMLREAAEAHYEVGYGNDPFIAGVAIVFAVLPHSPARQSSDDPTTGLNADASKVEIGKLDIKCYFLSDARSKVGSPDIFDLVTELNAWLHGDLGPISGAPPLISLLPTFVYDMGLRHHVMVRPELGDIVKVRSDSSSLLSGECEAITRANIAQLLVMDKEIAADPSLMKSALAETIDEAPVCTGQQTAPTYNPQSMHISDAGVQFIIDLEGSRRWIYNDIDPGNAPYTEWMGDDHSPLFRWKWADYYVPKEFIDLAGDWLTKYRGPTGFAPQAVPTIGVGHAIKIQHADPKYGSLLGADINEREEFDNNFKKDMSGMPLRSQRRTAMAAAGKRYWSKTNNPARIGYSPTEGDSPPMSDARITQLARADMESHCRYFKANITKPITQAQFDALASMAFNRGPAVDALTKSIIPAINAGNCEKAAKAIVAAPGYQAEAKVLRGGGSPGDQPSQSQKEKRRLKEATLFAKGSYRGGKTPANLLQHLNDRREADAEIFLESNGNRKKYVGKTAWMSGTDAYADYISEGNAELITTNDGLEFPPPPTEDKSADGNTSETIGSPPVAT